MHFTRDREKPLSLSLFSFSWRLLLVAAFFSLQIKVRSLFLLPSYIPLYFAVFRRGNSFSREQSRRDCSSIEIPAVADSINFLTMEFHRTLSIFRFHTARDCAIVVIWLAYGLSCGFARLLLLPNAQSEPINVSIGHTFEHTRVFPKITKISSKLRWEKNRFYVKRST